MSELALRGGPPVRSTPYPPWPMWDEREREAVLGVLDSGAWWSTEGARTSEFEAAWGAFHGTGPAVACTNGTHAIELALTAVGVGEGDEVIVPDWTFVATASAVLTVNATPVLVDVDLGTGCIDPHLVEAAITARTRAVIAVHVAGHPADLDRLTAICERHGLALVEDCAHAHGSRWRDRPVATFGDAGTFSFQASKLMTAGEGGAVVSRRDDVLAAARSYADCGRRPGRWFYDHDVLGGNDRMTEWQAAVLLAQLDRFPEQQLNRDANARWLNAILTEIPGVHPQTRDPRTTMQGSYCYVVRMDADVFGAPVDLVHAALLAEGIPMTMAYPPLHRLDVFSTPGALAPRYRTRPPLDPGPLPVTDRLADETLWFRTAVLMGSRGDAQDLVDSLAKVHAHAGELCVDV